MESLISSHHRSDLYKVFCKIHKRVTKEFYSWKTKCWGVCESSVCGSKKLLYYPTFCMLRPLTHQFPPNTLAIITRISIKDCGVMMKNITKAFMLKIKITPSLQTMCPRWRWLWAEDNMGSFHLQEEGRVITEKTPLGSHCSERDEVSKECNDWQEGCGGDTAY